jgi:DNA-binding NtrC family response regulator
MGGRVWVESEEGKGTQFHFTMVLNSVDKTVAEDSFPHALASLPDADQKCLVIEHSNIVRELLIREIGAFGLQPMAAANFDEASTCLQLNRFSVVIVDGSLPKADSFVKKLATSASNSRVIISSTLGTVTDFDGPNVVTNLVKPTRRWRLFKALEKALSGPPANNVKDADDLPTSKELQKRTLTNLAYRNPLRILV